MWNLCDNGFCAVFYLIHMLISPYKFVISDDTEIISVTLFFHSLIMLIHCFVFVCIKSAYVFIKSHDGPRKSCFYDEYYLKIDQYRNNFNDGYEIPNAEQSIYNEVDDDIVKRRTLSSFKKTVRADVYREPKQKISYVEIPLNVAEEYDTVRVLG